jgi:hypothetical protein
MINMKNIVKVLFATAGIALIFSACHKEGALPYYKAGNASVLTSSSNAVTAAVADSVKLALSLNWTWPNYATDSAHQKFIVEIDSTGHNFAKPWAQVLTGKMSTSFTSKDLNMIVFGFGAVKNVPYSLDIRVVSSYANNNELYLSNTVNVKVTPYIIPVKLAINPAGPLTLTMANGSTTAVTCNWNATQFGNQALNYAIQMVKSGDPWTNPVVTNVGTALTGNYTVTALNRAAIAAGIAANTTGAVDFRVIAYQGTNYANPVYSNVVSMTVTTYLDVVQFWVVGGYNGWDNSDNALFIKNTPATGANAEGYVNFASAGEFKLVTDHSWDNNHTFGDDGTNTGKLSNVNGGSNISLSPAGYYLIKANPLTMTYSMTQTTWGVIGSSTPGGWGSQTDMTYVDALKIFKIGMTMPVGEFKFRGTPSWSINYGCTAADGKTLDRDGSNIPIATAGDYAITLDLSHPNAYTFSANTWGVIGSATADGWNSDQKMSWDAVNGVFTITMALTAGEIKFRANSGWDVNLGGSTSALTQNGSNIAIDAAGNYKITLDPWALTATITQL